MSFQSFNNIDCKQTIILKNKIIIPLHPTVHWNDKLYNWFYPFLGHKKWNIIIKSPYTSRILEQHDKNGKCTWKSRQDIIHYHTY